MQSKMRCNGKRKRVPNAARNRPPDKPIPDLFSFPTGSFVSRFSFLATLLVTHIWTMTDSTEASTLLSRTVVLVPTQDERNRKKLLWLGCAAAVACTVFGLGAVAGPYNKKDNKIVFGLGASMAGSYKKDKTKATDSGAASSGVTYCEDGGYSKRTLKLAYELPFASLFRDTKGQKKYEASSVVIVEDNAYAICDSSWAISKFGSQLQPFADGNVQLGDPSREEDESGYEALFHEDGVFYVLRESIQGEDDTYHAIIEELVLGAEEYSIGEVCTCEYEFEGDSKGYEGAVAVHDLDNQMIVLGLCEGNHCSESRKKDKGNGRLVAMRKENGSDGRCQWSTIREIKIPETAFFADYSAIALSSQGRAAISSQEESQVWLGHLLGQNEDGLWDIDAMEFSTEKTKVYDFPKNDQCMTIYCNIEGIHWINDEMLMAVSDKMKSKGKQDFRCFDKDQSVHVFVLP